MDGAEETTAEMATAEMATTAVLVLAQPLKPKYSEMRKRQNRAAQKTYREKRKQRLARVRELEELASAAGLLSTPTPGGKSASSSSHAVVSEDAEQSNTKIGQSQATHTVTSSIGSLSPGSAPWFDNLDLMQDIPLSPLELVNFDLDSTATAFPEPNIFPIMPDSNSSWQLSTTRPTFSATHADKDTINVKWIRSVVLRNSRKDQHLKRLSNTFPPFSPWDPYTNNLTLTSLNFITACLANCIYLGISPAAFCDDDALSPFYRPASTPTPYGEIPELADILVAQTQNAFANLKPDLRPTRTQILVRHEPWVDILPFPTLRDALIAGIAAALERGEDEPPEGWREDVRAAVSAEVCVFDTRIEAEFWDDVVKNDGLVCWGSTGGKDDEGKESSGNGTPWEARSWEGRKWFLEKWGDLLGEGGGELGMASAWWRSMRGEDLHG